MARYAATTTVSTERSRQQIETLITSYGAKSYGYLHEEGLSIIQFDFKDVRIRFKLPMPKPDDKEFQKTPTGKPRTQDQRHVAWDQACRQRWRAMHLAVKAKLECVTSGITTFEKEFFAYTVDPATNRTIYDVIAPQLLESYKSGKPMPLMLESSTSH